MRGRDAETAAEIGGDRGRGFRPRAAAACARHGWRDRGRRGGTRSRRRARSSAAMKYQVSSRRPQPSSVLSSPASVYISVSRSGEMLRPRCSKSSPVLATTMSPPARQHAAQAERQLGAADAAGERDHASPLGHHRNRSSSAGGSARWPAWPARTSVRPRTSTAGCASSPGPSAARPRPRSRRQNRSR